MSTSRLYLFSKDTGATATEQGYHYQKLKTLKTWLGNRIAKVEEVIYCDYEDDIFQRNFNTGTSKFRQIKLYSSNFSFSTEEITKSITNFFMLFTKGDYLYDDAQFVFETNSSIAREIRGNDANLLKEWNDNQGNMSEYLVDRCKTRVKVIVDSYIQEGYAKQMKGDTTGDFLKAKNYYEQLPDEFWDTFIKSISWQFESVQQNEAIPKLLEEIELLIAQLPLPIDVESASTYLAVLHYEIATRTAEPDEQERMLTNELLDVVILNKGSERDKWYAEVFQKWSAVATISIFTVGSFYEVIDAARYCRWNLPGSEHSQVWLRLLKMYIDLPETIVLCKRKAIYEHLFLKMSPDMTTGRPGGSIEDEVDLIKFYFENFQERNSLADIEDDITLLQIVFTQWVKTQDFIDPELITQWRTMIEDYIEERLVSPRDVDEQCQLYDLKGSTILHFNVGRDKAGKVNEALNVYRQIIPLLGETKLYTISRLSDLLKQMIDVYIQFGIQNDEVVDAIEEFLSEIANKAVQTGNQHNQAHEFVERGVKYLKQGGAKNFLRALDCFQKSAKLWLLNDTKDGYILAMVNIAQLYSVLGANLAGKYYALCGIWSSFNFGDADSFKRIPDSYAMVFHADFKQGAWMSALGDFLNFMNTRQQFDPQGLNGQELLTKTFIDLDLILESAEYINPELVHFINFYKQNLRTYYSEHMQYLVAPLKSALQGMENVPEFIAKKIEDTPFNDLGAERTIRFKMIGVEWRITFTNSYALTAIAEEFAALLQITLCEIGLSGREIMLSPDLITIYVEESEKLDSLISQTDTANASWKLALPLVNEHDLDKVKMRYACMATSIKIMLKRTSNLDEAAMEALFDLLYKKQRLGEKGLGPTAYQRAFFNAFSQEDFDASQRNNFPSPGERFSTGLYDNLANNTGNKR